MVGPVATWYHCDITDSNDHAGRHKFQEVGKSGRSRLFWKQKIREFKSHLPDVSG